MDQIKDQSPDSQLRQSIFGFIFCTVPLAVAALVIATSNTGCTIVNGNVTAPAIIDDSIDDSDVFRATNGTTYPLLSPENPLNLYLVVWGGASLGIGICQVLSTFALTRNTESTVLRVVQGMLMAAAVVFAFGCFVWSLILRFQIAPGCESPGQPLWTMFIVAVVFACLSGVCLTIAFLCMLCACCGVLLSSSGENSGLLRT